MEGRDRDVIRAKSAIKLAQNELTKKKTPFDIWLQDNHYTGSEPGTFQITSQNLCHLSYWLYFTWIVTRN